MGAVSALIVCSVWKTSPVLMGELSLITGVTPGQQAKIHLLSVDIALDV